LLIFFGFYAPVGFVGTHRTEREAAAPKQRSLIVPLVAGIVALLAIAGGTLVFSWCWPDRLRRAGRPNRSQAQDIFPSWCCHSRISQATQTNFFADGITENLTTDLSRIRNSFVIARNTGRLAPLLTFRHADHGRVAEELQQRLHRRDDASERGSADGGPDAIDDLKPPSIISR
jgi:hypothetical protein